MNETIFFYFYNLAHRSILLDKVIVFFADTFPYVVVLLAMAFLLFHYDILPSQNIFKSLKAKWREIALILFSGVFAWFLSYVLKLFFHTLRPFTKLDSISSLISETGYAFPSGHATFFMALALAIFLNHKKAGYLFIFFALLIGVARIIAGVHFPVDILGGFTLGILTAYIVRFLYLKISMRKI